jgi:hypothetical protein
VRTWRKIAREREAMSQGSAAREAWETALMLFEELQLPDADEIRELLGRSRLRAAAAADAMTGCRAGGVRRRATVRR